MWMFSLKVQCRLILYKRIVAHSSDIVMLWVIRSKSYISLVSHWASSHSYFGTLLYWCKVLRLACLYVCLFVSDRLHISKTKRPNLTKFSAYFCCGRRSVLLWRQYNTLGTSAFMNYVMFSYNSGNMSRNLRRDMFRPVRQVAAPGVKSAVSDCILFNWVWGTPESLLMQGQRLKLILKRCLQDVYRRWTCD